MNEITTKFLSILDELEQNHLSEREKERESYISSINELLRQQKETHKLYAQKLSEISRHYKQTMNEMREHYEVTLNKLNKQLIEHQKQLNEIQKKYLS